MGDDASDVVICTFSMLTSREKNGWRVSISFTRYNSSVSVTFVNTPDVILKRCVVRSNTLFFVFHCDDVPRQTISSGNIELASAMKTFLTMGLVHSKPEECDMARTIVLFNCPFERLVRLARDRDRVER